MEEEIVRGAKEIVEDAGDADMRVAIRSKVGKSFDEE